MLTHEEWANGGWYESWFDARRPTNPARDTSRRYRGGRGTGPRTDKGLALSGIDLL